MFQSKYLLLLEDLGMPDHRLLSSRWEQLSCLSEWHVHRGSSELLVAAVGELHHVVGIAVLVSLVHFVALLDRVLVRRRVLHLLDRAHRPQHRAVAYVAQLPDAVFAKRFHAALLRLLLLLDVQGLHDDVLTVQVVVVPD